MSTIIYARVSTADQDLTHQRDRLWDHAVEELGVDPDEIDVIEDHSTGTDIDRSGYRELMDHVEEGDADRVVVRSVSRVARNMRDLQNTVGEILDGGAGLHFVTDGLALEPGSEGDKNGMDTRDKILLNVLGLAAELEADLLRERTLDGLRAAEQAGKHVGRPPYGFKTDEEGFLIPSEDYQRAREVIEAIEELDWSTRKTARHTGVPRRTVDRILDRRDLYLGATAPADD